MCMSNRRPMPSCGAVADSFTDADLRAMANSLASDDGKPAAIVSCSALMDHNIREVFATAILLGIDRMPSLPATLEGSYA